LRLRDLLSFSSTLLSAIDIVRFVDVHTPLAAAPRSTLPFDISGHPDAASFSATSTLHRLESDCKLFEQQSKLERDAVLKVERETLSLLHSLYFFLLKAFL
jgi:hypothetical protein